MKWDMLLDQHPCWFWNSILINKIFLNRVRIGDLTIFLIKLFPTDFKDSG